MQIALPLFLWGPVFISGQCVSRRYCSRSTVDETLMCVLDEEARLIYYGALDRYLWAKFLKNFFLVFTSRFGGGGGTRTRDLRRDRPPYPYLGT